MQRTSWVLLRLTHAVNQIFWALHVVFSGNRCNFSHLHEKKITFYFNPKKKQLEDLGIFLSSESECSIACFQLQSRATTQAGCVSSMCDHANQYAVTIQSLNVPIRNRPCLKLAWGWKVCIIERIQHVSHFGPFIPTQEICAVLLPDIKVRKTTKKKFKSLFM